jgi:hypothetical protein
MKKLEGRFFFFTSKFDVGRSAFDVRAARVDQIRRRRGWEREPERSGDSRPDCLRILPAICDSPDNGGSMPGERDALGRVFRVSLAAHWHASCKLALPAPSAPGSAAEGGAVDSEPLGTGGDDGRSKQVFRLFICHLIRLSEVSVRGNL